MLNTWSGIEFEDDPIRKLQGVIQSVSVLILISRSLLKFYIDPCIFFAAFQIFRPLGRLSFLITSINS
jgi:hypothetical protein